MTNPAVEVQQYGQSLWLDYIHRKEIEDGHLKSLIDDHIILGITSNPSIFQKVIGESSAYDAAMSQMLDSDPQTVYERLAIEDIRDAADLFMPVYERTNRQDGYVSFEVSPLLANDTDATIEEAKRLFAAVDRPNIMIKIPGTAAGIPAIEEVIAAGINVNVTLLFAVESYELVAEAYIRGIERRLALGEAVNHIASVASFFVGRIDSAVDRILENNMRGAQVHANTARMAANREMLGQAAIANAKLAYRAFKRLFHGTRFKALHERGANVQRPLWASTGTKNPSYTDTRYVELLIGKDTVNTVPPHTLEAFLDHGTADETLSKEVDGILSPEDVLRNLRQLNIDFDAVTKRLQVDGVEAFTESFETLIDQVDAKLTVLRSGVMDRQNLALSIYGQAFNKAITDLEKRFVNERLWNKDGEIWTSHNPTIKKIEGRLGWLDVLDTIDIERLKVLQTNIQNADFAHVVLLGMGGSSLAPEVLYQTFGKQPDFPDFIVLDNTNPERIREIEAHIKVDKTLFIVSSKSGTTAETLAFFQYFWQQTNGNGQQFIAITDPDTPLATMAEARHFKDCYINPADIGGRYSALSYFGMVPAAIMGLDLDQLWEQAKLMIDATHERIPGQFHPGISLGVLIGVLGQQGRDKVTIYATESVSAFGDWAEQLLAESLGKQGKGVIPVINSHIGNPAEYVTDRLFIYLRVDQDSDTREKDAAIAALREAGHPRTTLRIPDKYAIAGEFFRWEYATAIAGGIMELNPFDEPNVAEAKSATYEKLTYYHQHQKLPNVEPLITAQSGTLFSDETTVEPLREMCRSHGYDPNNLSEVVAAQFAGTHAGDYFAFLCYFLPTPERKTIMHEIQHRLRKATKRAVTIGYGPRYLHSTGQLHKGGANNGIFFQITTELGEDIAIPDEDHSFGVLYTAQAAGDLDTLFKHNRRTLRLHLQNPLEESLRHLLEAIRIVEERRF